jgi:putative ABC transport system permease protein
MTLMQHGQQALINLGAAKLRAFLALLGILVGTAAVVALLSCGQLATEKALLQFKALGTDLLAVTTYQSSAGAMGNQLPLTFWQNIPDQIPYIKRAAPYGTSYQPLSFNGYSLQGSIIGADENLADIIHIKLNQGRFISFIDQQKPVCVLGWTLAKQLQEIQFGDPIGKQIRLDRNLYTIIGIARPWTENAFFNEDINQAAIIPVSALSLLSKNGIINNAIFSLESNSPIDAISEKIKQLIEAQSSKLGVFARSPKQIIASMENQGRIFTLLLAIIGSISLLVGGIGIMNVMLVSVSERKKEIGIRKAVGAKNKDIQALFLMESTMLSFLGGALGILLGLVVTYIIAYFCEWPFLFYPLPSIAGFAVSVSTGVFFGYYPAHRASQLEPIQSLRSD